MSSAGTSGDTLTVDFDVFPVDDEDVYEETSSCALEDILTLAEEQEEEEESEEEAPIRLSCDEDILIWAVSVLGRTGVGRALMAEACIEGWSLEIDNTDIGGFVLDRQLRILILPRFSVSAGTFSRSLESRNMFLAEAVRGLRGVWQEMTWVRASGEFSFEDRILWQRLTRADGDLMAIQVAWDLAAEGAGGFWHFLIASNMADLCEAFRAAVTKHPDMLEDGSLLTHMALRWMDEEARLEEVDATTLEEMDEDLRRQNRGRKVGQDTRRIEPQDVMRLSRLPFPESVEVCYLAPVARTLLCDPFFRRMPDPVGEAHLAQILEDSVPLARALGFRDAELAQKIFPDHILNTLV